MYGWISERLLLTRNSFHFLWLMALKLTRALFEAYKSFRDLNLRTTLLKLEKCTASL
jgi:hypothetical protein